jgi:hypothetical protein
MQVRGPFDYYYYYLTHLTHTYIPPNAGEHLHSLDSVYMFSLQGGGMFRMSQMSQMSQQAPDLQQYRVYGGHFRFIFDSFDSSEKQG